MRWVVHHVITGQALFPGAALVCLACVLLTIRAKWVVRAAAVVALALGAVLVWVSGTPMPLWLPWAWVAVGGAWLLLLILRDVVRHLRRPALAAGGLLVLLSVTAAGIELPWHLRPAMPDGRHRVMYAIGDSLTAGIGREARRWPEIVAASHGVRVVNLAVAGASAETGLTQAERIPDGPALVFLAIGGNDLLGRTAPQKFEGDLEKLLQCATGPGRQLVMLELPTLPFPQGLGRVQRRLADKYNAILVPKRFFAGVLFAEGQPWIAFT